MKKVETKETKALGIKAEVVRALRRHKVLTKFLKNTKASGWVVNWSKINSGSDAVLWAFGWNKSNEGEEYWDNLYSRMLRKEEAMEIANKKIQVQVDNQYKT